MDIYLTFHLSGKAAKEGEASDQMVLSMQLQEVCRPGRVRQSLLNTCVPSTRLQWAILQGPGHGLQPEGIADHP